MLAILIIKTVISSVLENMENLALNAFTKTQEMNDELSREVNKNSTAKYTYATTIIYYVRKIHMFSSILMKSIKH